MDKVGRDLPISLSHQGLRSPSPPFPKTNEKAATMTSAMGTFSRLSQAVNPAKLHQLLAPLWQTIAACIATATSPNMARYAISPHLPTTLSFHDLLSLCSLSASPCFHGHLSPSTPCHKYIVSLTTSIGIGGDLVAGVRGVVAPLIGRARCPPLPRSTRLALTPPFAHPKTWCALPSSPPLMARGRCASPPAQAPARCPRLAQDVVAP